MVTQIVCIVLGVWRLTYSNLHNILKLMLFPSEIKKSQGMYLLDSYNQTYSIFTGYSSFAPSLQSHHQVNYIFV